MCHWRNLEWVKIRGIKWLIVLYSFSHAMEKWPSFATLLWWSVVEFERPDNQFEALLGAIGGLKVIYKISTKEGYYSILSDILSFLRLFLYAFVLRSQAISCVDFGIKLINWPKACSRVNLNNYETFLLTVILNKEMSIHGRKRHSCNLLKTSPNAALCCQKVTV